MADADGISHGGLVDLAPELLDLVLGYLDPQDLVSFGRTYRRAHEFISPKNQLLWRSSFLQVFDDPNRAWRLLLPTARQANREREKTWDWYREICRRFVAFDNVSNAATTDQLPDSETVVPALLDLLETASFPPKDADYSTSLNIDFLNRLFREAPKAEKMIHDYHKDIGSSCLTLEFLADAGRPITRSMLGRSLLTVPVWASRFHIFYGLTAREDDSAQAKASARALVYDWNITGPNADFGPFKKDGSGTVNWQALEAAASLMNRVFETIRKPHNINSPCSFENSLPFRLPPNLVNTSDWAGINRSYLGTYAFLDYRALVHYNFANNLEYRMDLGQYEEACGDLMRLELDISDAEDLQNDLRLQSNLPYCQDLPKLYFKGSSRSQAHGRPHIVVKGCVFLAPGAREVRWRFIISYAGADQWHLEGAQPGGVRSRGIYGLWSHVDHDEHGPTGPFCYFPLECFEPFDND